MTHSPPVTFDADGLVPVVTTDAGTGDVLMVAFMNEAALSRTRETGFVHYWSRSRKRIWRKGESSGHVQKVLRIFVNCDLNSLLMEVEQTGAVCHDGYPTCFYRQLEPDGSLAVVRDRSFDPADVYGSGGLATTTDLWWRAYEELARPGHAGHSGTSRLLQPGEDAVTPRIADELNELAGALDGSHRHQDLRADIALEGGQVCYWTALRCIRGGIGFEAVRPDRALACPERTDVPSPETLARMIRALAGRWIDAGDNVPGLAHEAFASVARACAVAGIEPTTLIVADLEELRRRTYLASFFAGVDSPVTG